MQACEVPDEGIHRPAKAEFRVREEGADVVVACQYWEVRHARNFGGNIDSVVFPYGSGTNIFAAPFSTHIQRGLPFRGTPYENTRDIAPEMTWRQEAGAVHLACRSRLLDGDGAYLPVSCEHRFTYHPWGVIRQKVTLEFSESVPDAWNLSVANPTVAAHLDEFTFRPSWEAAPEWSLICNCAPWRKLHGGESLQDYSAVAAGDIPLHLIFLQRGVEGFDWFCGENLDQWHRQVSDIPHAGKFRVGYDAVRQGYHVQLDPLDLWTSSLELSGRLEFDFFMGLPFVNEHVRPMLRGAGISCGRDRGPSIPSYGGDAGADATSDHKRFLRHERIERLAACGGQLVRHHDDAAPLDGVFWRDGCYPPYPSDHMQAMDACIEDLHRHGIRATPYFSLHEWHPEAPGFAEKAELYKRTFREDGPLMLTYSQNGIFGGQMCLLSGWREILKRNIDTVLSHHAFDGLYFDWTMGLPCLNREHRPCAHWDVEGFMDVLEWARDRVGADGILYLHTSLDPFIMAENLANVVLVYEMSRPDQPTPDMFPPSAECMKTCSHFVLRGGPERRDPRRFMLYCLLNHVTVDNPSEEFLDAYQTLTKIDFTRYKSFADHRVSPASVSGADVRSAVYWDDDEALVLLANFSDSPAKVRWTLDTTRLGWDCGRSATSRRRSASLAPLAFRYVRIARTE